MSLDQSYEEEGESDIKSVKSETADSEKERFIEAESLYSLGAESIYGQSPLDELSDHELIEFLLEMELEHKHLRCENKMFKQFLIKNDPISLDGYETLLNYVKRPPEDRSGPPPIFQADMTSSTVIRRSHMRLESITSLSTIIEGRGPKINLSHKSDMVLKAMEEKQAGLESYLKKSHRIKQNIKADLEEYSVRESDVKEAREIFEHNIVVLGVDPLTQRIPAEKFVRYMEEWLKSAQLNIEKLRLRTATLSIEYQKVSATLDQRRELGENVHPVDFDQLKIENKHYRNKIDQKSLYLLELKRMNGGHNLSLSNHKKYLHKLQKDFNDLNSDIAVNERLIADTEKQCTVMTEELEKAHDKFERFKKLKSIYNVPDVIDYVKLKSNLYDIRQDIKVWERRKNIQDITMNACLRQMKNITGSPLVDHDWLEDRTSVGSLHDDPEVWDNI